MRDKLIELLTQKYDHYCDQCGVNKQSNYIENLADYLIANGITFATDNNVPRKWIPVSERLPETGGQYLIYGNVIWTRIWLSNFDKELGKFGSWWDYEPDGTKHERYRFIETEVTHWMPFPEPPHEG